MQIIANKCPVPMGDYIEEEGMFVLSFDGFYSGVISDYRCKIGFEEINHYD